MEVNKIYNIDALSGLKQLNNNSIDCIITSPPYYQLRDYGVEGQIGLEVSVNEYIDKLVEIFIECKRVLKEAGTMFIVISDTFNGSKLGKTDKKLSYLPKQNINKKVQNKLSRKTLLCVPERLAIKLVDNGLILRNKIIWQKPNAMPSSVKDRFTIDYEIILFFSKSTKYYFNQLKEPMKTKDKSKPRGSKGVIGQLNSGRRIKNEFELNLDFTRSMRSVWMLSTQPTRNNHYATFPEKLVKRLVECGCPLNGLILDPFIGSGTTARVAVELNRNFIGFEINESYIKNGGK